MTRPALAFLGVGWIGLDRMRAIAESRIADICFVADVDANAAERAARETGANVGTWPDLLDDPNLDGVVIATPSALHAEQAIAAFDAGLAVFCQKPLARTAAETAAVVAAASRADRLLGVDLSYRHLDAVVRMRDVITSGAIGDVYSADLTFHNAYGPDKQWFTDPCLSGGGCVIDLGTHLIDLAQRMLGDQLHPLDARLYAGGRRVGPGTSVVEDFASAWLETGQGASVRLACSWNLHAGCDAVIELAFYAVAGAVVLRNVEGSFYDFAAWLHRGTQRELLASPPDRWGGRAAIRWAQQLASDPRHRPEEGDELVALAAVIDGIYDR